MPYVRTRQPDPLVDCPAGLHRHIIEDYKECACGALLCPSCVQSELLWELGACGEHCALMAVLALERRAYGLAGAVEDFKLSVARAEERAAA